MNQYIQEVVDSFIVLYKYGQLETNVAFSVEGLYNYHVIVLHHLHIVSHDN